MKHKYSITCKYFSNPKYCEFPICSNNNDSSPSLVDTNILFIDDKLPTIILNFLALQLIDFLKENITKIYVIGLSDRLTSFKEIIDGSIQNNDCITNFVPPEFISNIAASFVNLRPKNTTVWLLPSEGPIGFEKINPEYIELLALKIMDNLSVPRDFVHHCLKNWSENNGSHVTTLYI
ncbi:Pba1p SCDLUD_000224 [Saccharomycodes ludwigii]|nr:hypothetical protein SCDLUD_000224 [Saccharomycodes ludwigii]KAH3902643.1 hypothetical protein SCDLUD_000224 [Saccharomycodes ludwigii]